MVMYGCERWTIRKLSTEELSAVELWYWEKTLESPLDCKEIQRVYPKGNQSWIIIGRTDAEIETPILWPCNAKNWLTKKDWWWERLKAGGEGDDRRWDGWMASLTLWTWVCASSGSWWRTGKPGLLQMIRSQRVKHDWVTELTDFCTNTHFHSSRTLRITITFISPLLWNVSTLPFFIFQNTYQRNELQFHLTWQEGTVSRNA